MYKVNVRKLGNVERFIGMVEQSRGSVYLVLPNKELCDLKRNSEACQMLYMINPKEIWLDLLLTDVQDGYQIMEYMMNAS